MNMDEDLLFYVFGITSRHMTELRRTLQKTFFSEEECKQLEGMDIFLKFISDNEANRCANEIMRLITEKTGIERFLKKERRLV